MGTTNYDVNIAADSVGIGNWGAVSRPTCDLGVTCIIMDHETVTADYAVNQSGPYGHTSGYDLWITDLTVVTNTDPTTEVAIQPIPFKVAIYDSTSGAYRWIGVGSIPNCCHFSFRTPIRIKSGKALKTWFCLGGATDLAIIVILNGYEVAV